MGTLLQNPSSIDTSFYKKKPKGMSTAEYIATQYEGTDGDGGLSDTGTSVFSPC